MKFIIWISSMILIFATIGFTFWHQEIKYWEPTPIPDGIIEMKTGFKAPLKKIGFNEQLKKPIHVHFFNVDCPCSRFNLKEFESLVHEFDEKIDFVVVLQAEIYSEEKRKNIQKKIGKKIPIFMDQDGSISASFGIYAAPQAVIIQEDGNIYYKGNYNINRYCVSTETAFAKISLQQLLDNKPLPNFNVLAETPYGCLLPSYIQNP